jgi:hypothetical protein
MVRPSIYGIVASLSAMVVWSLTTSCNSDDAGSFGNAGGSTSAGGSNASFGGSTNATGSITGSGGVIAGTVDQDAGTFEPVTTVEDPETPYVTTCDGCPATEPLHVQCSSGCCCAHYCEGQFGSATDKPCCDEQGGVIGLNCVSQ